MNCLLTNKIVLLCTMAILLANQGITQRNSADSLRQVINTQPANKEKAGNLISLTRNFLSKQLFDSALVFCEKAQQLSVQIDFQEGVADALYLKGLIYSRKQEFTAALANFNAAIDLLVEMHDSVRLTRAYYNFGMTNKSAGNYDLALYYCRKSLAYSILLKDSTLIPANYNSMGNIFSEGLATNDSAIIYYLKALKIYERSGNTNNISTLITNLGNLFLEERNYEMAGKYLHQSLQLSVGSENKNMVALNLSNLGRLARARNEIDSALFYYNAASEVYSGLNDQWGIADNQVNIGDVSFSQKKYAEAAAYFEKALLYYEKMAYPKGIITALLNKSAAYSEMGKVKMAVELQDSCLRLAGNLGNDKLKIQAYKNIADNYYKSGQYAKAYDCLVEMNKLKNLLFDIDKTKGVHDLLIKYEKEKDQSRILSLEKDNLEKTNQRNFYLFTAIGFIFLALFLVVYLRQKARHDKSIARQKIRQLEEEKKLMAAKLLVEGQEVERKRIATELHDGLGVLLSATKMQFSVIRDKSPENKKLIEKATEMLDQASGDVRKISHNMMPGLLTKLGFFEAIGDLFEQIGDAGEIHTSCIIEGNQVRLPENREIMLYRIIQEMVNNTLKHAHAEKMAISVNILPDKLIINYSDDGVGFDYTKELESESLGLKSIQSRVNFLNGTLMVDAKPGSGVKFSMTVPA